MRELTVLYDAECGLCGRLRMWLQAEPKFVDLEFVAAASPEAVARFPLLNHEVTLRELTVVSDNGDYYQGTNAWVMCLWALREYREWALRFAQPAFRPYVHRFVMRLSRQRFRIGQFISAPGPQTWND